LTYTFTVPNGNYNVFLKWAELATATRGQRVFHVDINGARVVSNLDVYGEGGRFNAVKRTIPISVSGGRIQITFTPVTGSPIINAIEVGRR
jgi:hypothetical protein